MNHKEYEAIKAKEWEAAQARVEAIRESKDPRVLYRDIRPIIDLKHMLMTSVELYGDRPAFHVKDTSASPYRSITYKQLKADVDHLGTSLVSLGLQGKKISIIGDNSYPWAVSYLAAACGTGIVVPLDKELPANELEQLIAQGDVECVLFAKKFESIFRDIKAAGKTALSTLINLDAEEEKDGVLSFQELLKKGEDQLAQGDLRFVDAVIDREVLGILLFTSGTTGISKGVMLSHGNIAENLMASPTLVEVTPNDVFFSVLPIHHTYECTDGFLMPIYRGSSIAICEGLKHILKNLEEAKPTMFLCVPLIMESIYKRIWKTAEKSGSAGKLRKLLKINRVTRKVGINLVPKKITNVFGGRMKTMICGGAAIDPAILDGINDFGINCLQGYGLTECSPICALNPDKAKKSASAGYIPPGFEIKIDQPDPVTGIGEICAKGGHIMMGYFHNEEATNEVLKDGWFHTGDLGYLDQENYVYITGRKKNVIITKNGKNVYPEELEYYLGKIPYVEESMVWAKDAETGDDTVICASIKIDQEEIQGVLGEVFTDQQAAELLWQEIDKINDDIPYFKRIKKIDVRRTDFEKTTGKKIKRFVDANKGSN